MPQSNLKTDHAKDPFCFNLKSRIPKKLFGNKTYIQKLTLMGLPPNYWICLNKWKRKPPKQKQFTSNQCL
jgi:hypothetical protein